MTAHYWVCDLRRKSGEIDCLASILVTGGWGVCRSGVVKMETNQKLTCHSNKSCLVGSKKVHDRD